MREGKHLTRRSTKALAVPDLGPRELDAVRLLAQAGNFEPTIRRALGLNPSQWRKLKADTDDGDPSPLMLALEEGRAEGAGEVVAFMRARMKEGDVVAATWLGEKLYRIGKDDTASADTQRVQIVINAALSPEEYSKVINVTPAPGALP